MINRLDYLSFDKRLRELGLFGEEKAQERFYLSQSVPEESAKKTEQGSFQWYPMPGQKAVGTNFLRWKSVKI